MPEPRRITLTPRAAIAAGIVAFLLLALLAAQLTFIVQQRQIVAQQRDIATRQEHRAAPVLDSTRALIGSPADARRAVREAGGALRDLQGLLDTVRRTQLVPVTAEVLRTVRDQGLVRGAGRFLQAALGRDLVGVTTRALSRTPELIGAVERARSILERTYPTLRSSLRIQRDTRGLQRTAVGLQRQSLDIQRRTLDALGQTLDIARETLAHVESIDRKTGGTVPPVP